MIISQPKTSFLGVIFDVDHDFEGRRAPKAHLDTVMTKPVTSPGQALYRTHPRPTRTAQAHWPHWQRSRYAPVVCCHLGLEHASRQGGQTHNTPPPVTKRYPVCFFSLSLALTPFTFSGHRHGHRLRHRHRWLACGCRLGIGHRCGLYTRAGLRVA